MRARYLCSGDFITGGGRYCLGFGGATVGRRVGAEIVRVLSPLGIQASVAAIDRLGAQEHERRHALQRELQQLEYEATRACDHYDEADPRNRLVASELERRWNVTLQALEQGRADLAELDSQCQPVSGETRNALLAFGERFTDVWNHPACPVEIKKQIVRSIIEEIVVDEDPPGRLSFIVHWTGGSHTACEMEKVTPTTVHRTVEADLTVIRKMAARYDDGAIARVLNKLGRRTGKGHPWSHTSVKTARRNHGIDGRRRPLEDPDVLSLHAAVRYTDTSDTTIKQLVDVGILPMRQLVAFAPWEIQRTDLDSERVRGILAHLKRTGRLVLGDASETLRELFQ